MSGIRLVLIRSLDRILCFEIVTKKKEGWVLKYVKSAKASTDVPTTVCSLFFHSILL
jgi:cellulose synthase/poly-beta-1,6-N-acetylglucosamine synthase-like glycosyltransferase